jgi:phosphoenolpyruvate carboxykinase (ATP)
MDINTTRAIIDAIHDGSLLKESYSKFEVFGFDIPNQCNGVDSNILHPR